MKHTSNFGTLYFFLYKNTMLTIWFYKFFMIFLAIKSRKTCSTDLEWVETIQLWIQL